jgi:3-deoxy-D-manno-octulosonic-acid transferase
MLILYNLLLTIFAPIWMPWMLFRTWRRKEQPNWKERCGDFEIQPRKDNKRVWVHAVSVGEVVASTPILRELKEQLPDHEIILTTTTSSGHKTARDTAQGLYDHLFYFPIDINRFQAVAMQRVQPAAIVVMETELWPNFLWWAKVFDTRTLLVNGRISDRSFRRSKGLKAFYAMMLKNVNRCLMQTDGDAERIKALGATTTEVFGNAKFDQATRSAQADPEKWRRELKLPFGLPIVVIGSTRGEEEERFVIEALQIVGLDKMAVVHAPRHIERVPDLQKLVPILGIEPALRSQGAGGRYVILDTYGELDQIYSIADIVVIGGGFANLGGQNLLQPLAHGKPVIHGPHMQNFREVAEQADRSGAALPCSTPGELAATVSWLLKNPEDRERMGTAATKLIQQNVGASRRYAEAIAQEVRAFHANASK